MRTTKAKRTPLKRKTPLKQNPDAIRAWKSRTACRLPQRSSKRACQETRYRGLHSEFLDRYQICPVTGERTNQVHHSAKREGGWLNLRRYWIAVSDIGHQIIEENKSWAETVGLMVRIRQTYDEHVNQLAQSGDLLDEPIFYTTWDGNSLQPQQ